MATRGTRWLLWGAALLGVPAVLAAIALLAPGPQIAADVRPTVVPSTVPVTGSAPTAATPVTDVVVADPTRAVAERVRTLLRGSPITFAPYSAVLEGRSAETVRQVATLVSAAGRILLEGHVADIPGPDGDVQLLSERRAFAVADALVRAGVDRARITTVGRGDTAPLDTPAASRRVEIAVG